MNCAPIVMVKNEARFIAQVLRPLVAAFADVYVGDTGSTDGTAEIAEAMPNVRLTRYGPLPPAELGQVRAMLGQQAAADGYEWAFLVDGDELYSPEAAASIRTAEMPDGCVQGFTTLVSIDEPEPGKYLLLDDRFNRFAIFRADEAWRGEYPFEWPESWAWAQAGDRHYFAPPNGMAVHGLHLHRLQRSGHDDAVYRRKEKQFQFAMQDAEIAHTGPVEEPWLNYLR